MGFHTSDEEFEEYAHECGLLEAYREKKIQERKKVLRESRHPYDTSDEEFEESCWQISLRQDYEEKKIQEKAERERDEGLRKLGSEATCFARWFCPDTMMVQVHFKISFNMIYLIIYTILNNIIYRSLFN